MGGGGSWSTRRSAIVRGSGCATGGSSVGTGDGSRAAISGGVSAGGASTAWRTSLAMDGLTASSLPLAVSCCDAEPVSAATTISTAMPSSPAEIGAGALSPSQTKAAAAAPCRAIEAMTESDRRRAGMGQVETARSGAMATAAPAA